MRQSNVRIPPCTENAEGLCILHSQDKEKNSDAFQSALQARWNQEEQKSYDFRGIFFPEPFDPKDFFECWEFKKPLDFFWATFMNGADFSGATYTDEMNFSGATFIGEANFGRATFVKGADFSGATFTNRADFWGATFTKGANFSWATFTEGANFSGATFKEMAIFSRTVFSEVAHFIRASFTEGAKFIVATFTKGADFSESTFTEGVDFSRATIEERVVFQDINSRKKDEQMPPPFIGYFRHLEFQENGALRFQDLSLARVQFQGSDLRRAEFNHVQWHPYWGRQAVYDEVLLRHEEKQNPWFWTWLSCGPHADPPSFWTDKYAEVERLYRDLQENYEKARDYKKMGDFHYGEMEMHRRANKWRWFPFHWYNLYRSLSGYGERPFRALGWLAAFLAIFTGLLAWIGLDLDPEHIPAFGDSFFYLLQNVTPKRPTWAKPVGFWGNLVAGLSVLFIPGQAALFLLALRNRLGRRR